MREAGLQQRAGDHRAGDHEQRVEDVVGRDDAGAVRRLRAQLDQRVHRHAVQAGEERQQRRGRPSRASAPAGRRRRASAIAGRRAAGRARRSTGRSRTRSCRWRRAAPGRSRHGAATAPRTAASRCRCRSRTPPAAARRPARCRAAPPWRSVGNWLRNTAPKNHIQRDAQQRAEHHQVAVRQLQVAPGLADRVPVDRQVRDRSPATAGSHCATARPSSASADAGEGDVVRPDLGHGDQQAAGHLAEQDGDEGAHLDHAVAAGQLALVQVLRQVGELHRAEQRRVQAHQEDAGQQHGTRRRRRSPRREQP